jgi:hypothetical protein
MEVSENVWFVDFEVFEQAERSRFAGQTRYGLEKTAALRIEKWRMDVYSTLPGSAKWKSRLIKESLLSM